MLDRVVSNRKKVRREWSFQRNGRTYDVVSTPLTNADGSVSKLSILRDVTAIVQAQKALEERERLYRSVTEFIADGAVMVQDGVILFANHSFTEMFEYSIDDIRGMKATELFDVEFRDLFRRVFDPGEQDDTLGGALGGVCVRKGGREFWVSVHRSLIDLKNKPAILATMRDVTEEVQWEMSIQEESEYLRRENLKLKSSIKERYRFGKIVGKSPPMQKVYELILKAAGSDVNVLILGESGTGKELVARAVHEMSARAGKPFIPVNCGAIPESLVESEFFGHLRGAFTGAHIDKTGYLESANGGTLFLDEVGELGLNMQVKLLRSFEAGVYTPVGDTQERHSRLRLIAATNRDFSAMVGSGQIRQDFYYRISILPIVLPPLREKKEDIPLLVEHFLRLYFKGKKIPSIPAKVMDMFYKHDWPGNVRELQGVIQRYLAVGNFHFLSPRNQGLKNWEEEEPLPEEPMPVGEIREAVEDFERRFIKNALNQCRWHRGKTAGLLGVDPKTLYKKMQKLGL
jgi:PAS domain S-box-containing protein